MKRLAAVTLATLALAGCGKSERAESAAGTKLEPHPAERLELPAAEGPNHEVGTFGEQCERGRAEDLGAPDPDWSERVLTFGLGPDQEIPEVLPRPTRIRFPRDWDDESYGSGLEPFLVQTPYSQANLAEVSLTTLPADALSHAVGESPWDARIELFEASKDVEAKAARPVSGGRCLVVGTYYAGVFAAVLSPGESQETTIALAEFNGILDDLDSIEDVDPATLETTLRVLNSVEQIDSDLTVET